MALAIAEVTAEGADLLSEEAQDRIAGRWASWADTAKDVGIQTRQVFRSATRTVGTQPTAAGLRTAAAELHRRTGRTAGNGSLMRTAPVALAHLDDPAHTSSTSSSSSLAHLADPAQCLFEQQVVFLLLGPSGRPSPLKQQVVFLLVHQHETNLTLP